MLALDGSCVNYKGCLTHVFPYRLVGASGSHVCLCPVRNKNHLARCLSGVMLRENILALLSDVGIQTLQVLDVRLLPFWFKY